MQFKYTVFEKNLATRQYSLSEKYSLNTVFKM